MCAKDEDKVCSACLECNGLDLPSCVKHHRISKLIYEAQLEAVERYRELLIKQGNGIMMSVNYGGVLTPSDSERYLAELRKAAGRGE